MCREGPDVEFWGPVMAGVCFFPFIFFHSDYLGCAQRALNCQHSACEADVTVVVQGSLGQQCPKDPGREA